MSEFTQLQKEITQYIRRERIAMREDIIRDVSYDAGCTRKEVQEQLSHLRKHGYVWRVPEGGKEGTRRTLMLMRGDSGLKWTNVRERQPEKGKRVLVCIQTRFGTQIDIRRHLEGGRFVHFDQDGMITHWMPLPEPPEEG